ncbi:hypothetical protein FXN80_10735 [Dickeya fangzhongdai]|uniref:hypothetical protein n=1 Tax=Dickeya fangzhongdai TaxID=1778540 RepID=UPI001371C70E|nr:hypothetical protein [Dickeya fangzhongdai]UMB78839.1 hypothetical protein FXN80_10735 [Dickeya fangzhongdai]
MAQAMTYQEITQIAAAKIEAFMADSARKSDAEAVSGLYRDWAIGVFFLWSDIVGDKKLPADEERLSRLVGLRLDTEPQSFRKAQKLATEAQQTKDPHKWDEANRILRQATRTH